MAYYVGRLFINKFRNAKHLQKINIDPTQSKACPIDDADFADFLENLFERPAEEIDREWNYPLVTIPLFIMDDLKKRTYSIIQSSML